MIDPASLADTYRLPAVDRSVRGLTDDTVMTPRSCGYDVGARIEVHLADSTVAPLRVVATYEAPRGEDVAYLSMRYAQTADYARNGLARRAYVSLAPGTDRGAAPAAPSGAPSPAAASGWKPVSNLSPRKAPSPGTSSRSASARSP